MRQCPRRPWNTPFRSILSPQRKNRASVLAGVWARFTGLERGEAEGPEMQVNARELDDSAGGPRYCRQRLIAFAYFRAFSCISGQSIPGLRVLPAMMSRMQGNPFWNRSTPRTLRIDPSFLFLCDLRDLLFEPTERILSKPTASTLRSDEVGEPPRHDEHHDEEMNESSPTTVFCTSRSSLFTHHFFSAWSQRILHFGRDFCSAAISAAVTFVFCTSKLPRAGVLCNTDKSDTWVLLQ